MNRSHHQHRYAHRLRASATAGISLLDVVVSIAVLSLLLSLMAPAILSMRDRSQALECRNRLRQLGMAAQGRLATTGKFPKTSIPGQFDTSAGNASVAYISTSPFRELIASLDSNTADLIFQTEGDWGRDLAATFGHPFPPHDLGKQKIPVLICPSETQPQARLSYRANLGSAPSVHRSGMSQQDRLHSVGAFSNGFAITPAQFKDGMSNTVLFSERISGDFDANRYSPFRDSFRGQGNMMQVDAAMEICKTQAVATPDQPDSEAGKDWLLGGWLSSWYNHVAGPNSTVPDCASLHDFGGGDALLSARSLHAGFVNAGFADGSVKSVADEIAIDVWRAMGTREAIDSQSE